MENRIENLLQKASENFEAAIITSGENRYYLLGMRSSAGTLLIFKEKSYFIIDSRYIELAQKTVKNAEVILQGKLYAQINELLEKHKAKTVWVEETLALGTLNGFKNNIIGCEILLDSPLTSVVNELRSIKTKQELEYIKTAQTFTDAGFAHMCTLLAAGQKERDMAIELEHYMKLQGAEDLAFNIILVSGENSSLPHGVPGDKLIQKGDFVTMDFGSKYCGYCTDMTRTVAIGSATDEMKDVYNTVLDAQLQSLGMIKEGVCCADVDACARNIINKKYDGKFGHGLGHSLGIEVHEFPRFGAGSKTLLLEGMMMTVEPGIYLPGKFGVRIEDTVYVTKNGLINVAKSPKELIIL